MSVKYQDYYQSLGVERNVSQVDIQRAFRKLARQYHPDVNKTSEAEDRFKEISMVYSILGHPQRRRTYDLKLIEQMLY